MKLKNIINENTVSGSFTGGTSTGNFERRDFSRIRKLRRRPRYKKIILQQELLDKSNENSSEDK